MSARVAFCPVIVHFHRTSAGEGRFCWVATLPDDSQLIHDGSHTIAWFENDEDDAPNIFTCPARKRKQSITGTYRCERYTNSTVSTPAPLTAGTRM